MLGSAFTRSLCPAASCQQRGLHLEGSRELPVFPYQDPQVQPGSASCINFCEERQTRSSGDSNKLEEEEKVSFMT